MNNLSKYILEKLHLNKDIKVIENEYWFGESDDVDDLPAEFYKNRKSTRQENGVQKNKPWYAVYICLKSLNGIATRDKIRELVWPGKAGQQAELFSGLKEYGIIESIKGQQHLRNCKYWSVPQWPTNKIF